jgi:hypothetical protein
MSLARQFAAIGQVASAPVEEETITILPNGAAFQAKVYPYQEIGITDDLGPDLRGALTVESRNFSVLPSIAVNTKLLIYGYTWNVILSGDPITGAIHWKIHVKREAPQDQ